MGILKKFLVAAALLFCCRMLPGADEPLRKIVLLTSWQQQAQFAGFYMAQELGFYRDLGATLEIRHRGIHDDPVKLLESGQADVIVASLAEGITLHDRNPDVINIGQMFQQSSAVIVTRAEKGIRRIEDLNGKRMAVCPGNFSFRAELFCKEYGLNMEIIHTMNVDEVFLWGIADAAFMMHYHEYVLLLMSGMKPKDLNVLYLKDSGMDLPDDGIYCLKGRFNQSRSFWYKFNLATVRGWQQALEEETRTLAVIRNVCASAGVPFSLPLQRWMIRQLNDTIQTPQLERTAGVLDKESFDETAGLLFKHGLIRKIPEYREFYRGPLSTKKFRQEPPDNE